MRRHGILVKRSLTDVKVRGSSPSPGTNFFLQIFDEKWLFCFFGHLKGVATCILLKWGHVLIPKSYYRASYKLSIKHNICGNATFSGSP